jgi:hypothetical protein
LGFNVVFGQAISGQLDEAIYIRDTTLAGMGLQRIENDCEQKERIACLAAILTEGSNEFLKIEQSRFVAECHFDLHRIRAARYDLFLTMNDLEDVGGNDVENALRGMDRITGTRRWLCRSARENCANRTTKYRRFGRPSGSKMLRRPEFGSTNPNCDYRRTLN